MTIQLAAPLRLAYRKRRPSVWIGIVRDRANGTVELTSLPELGIPEPMRLPSRVAAMAYLEAMYAHGGGDAAKLPNVSPAPWGAGPPIPPVT